MKLADKSLFTNKLRQWDIHINGRKMPWKGEKNPYRIWLSEIILQQTRVEQGLSYYNRFIEKYPSIHDLAVAPETEIYKLWEGLGYYSRCGNLITTAKYISSELNGIFPQTYNDILQLKGIGPYTAAAIASFAYDLPYAVVDGNVYRLLSRYFGIDIPVTSTEGKKYFAELASQLLYKESPGKYNQAIIDLGATVCKPKPVCSDCPLNKSCTAFNTSSVALYPVKAKKAKKKTRWFYYVVAEYDGNILIKKREIKDIWQNLHELVLIESEKELISEDLYSQELFSEFSPDYRILDVSSAYCQQLTHQTIKGKFIHIELKSTPSLRGYRLEKRLDISKLAFPKFITEYFEDSRLLY